MPISFLSGLPRTGSTLLTSVLSQNPLVHAEGNSALCQLMWDMQVSCWNTEQLHNKPEVQDRLIASLPEIFYRGVDAHILDKCRSWTIPANMDLITKYITKAPKVVVMLRPISEVVASFVHVRKMNGWKDPEVGLLDEGTDPIMRSLDGVKYSKAINTGQFLYVWYADLVDKPEETIDRVYRHCGWEPFSHDFETITNTAKERDDLLNMVGLHDIRPQLGRRQLDVQLSSECAKKAAQLDAELLSL